MMSQSDPYIDVVELCALLQCLGFSVRSLDTQDGNNSQDGGARTVVINCQSSGLHVVLETASLSCSCPTNTNQQNSGVWQISGVTGGKQLDKEFGCSLLASLPKAHRDRLTLELREMIRCIKVHNESDHDKLRDKEGVVNKSESMVELKTPEKRHTLTQLKIETPTRYRSLDTLTAAKEAEKPLPTPRLLQKAYNPDTTNEDKSDIKMCRRQSTYTLSSTPGSSRIRNKTSSPINAAQKSILQGLIDAEKAAEELRNKLSIVIRDLTDDNKNDSSMSSLTLDVSKISILKGGESSKIQFASSPNLSGMGTEERTKMLKRVESASTSNLAVKPPTKERMSKLRRISPNIFNLKKNTPKVEKTKVPDAKSKFNSLFRPKIVTPVSVSRREASPNLSSSRKKLSAVKSTIPRPSAKKD